MSTSAIQGSSLVKSRPVIEYQEHGKKCGAKYDNLLILSEISKSFANVKVPCFLGISQEAIAQFLEQQGRVSRDKNIPLLWEELSSVYAVLEDTEKCHFLQKSETQGQLRELQDIIIALFSDHRNLESFAEYALIEQFLETMQAPFLMVRSSGNEDGRVANAGGNESISYVTPSTRDIFVAMGQVVASCFSMQSLQTRMRGGDDPFLSLPQTSVVLQELIGENSDSGLEDIPVSLVLFSKEPSYVSDPSLMRMMRIEATYGHGEGVVGNVAGVGVDQFFVLDSASELYVVKQPENKPMRLIPTHIGEQTCLQTCENNPQLQKKACLSNRTIKELYDFAHHVEERYGFPVDMEMIVKNGTIYVVQARAINRPERKEQPTFVDFSLFDETQVVQAEKILIATSLDARVLQDPAEILVVETMDEANEKIDPRKHRFVIVFQDEPPLSHLVVNFSEWGIPCIWCQHREPILSLLEKITDQGHLYVCLQEGKIGLWTDSLEETPLIKEGYTNHPASIRMSLSHPDNPFVLSPDAQMEFSPDVIETLRCLRTYQNTETALEHLVEQTPMEEMLSLKGRVQQADVLVQEGYSAIEKLIRKIRRTADALKGCDDTLGRLFYVKVLEQLTKVSLSVIPRMLPQLVRAIEYQEQRETSKFVIATAISSRPEWIEFLEELEQDNTLSSEEVNIFCVLMKTVIDTGLQGTWLYRFFIPLRAKKTTQEIFSSIIDTAKDLDWIRELQVERIHVELLHQRAQSFTHKEAFDVSFAALREQSQRFQGEFAERYHASGILGQFVALSVMRDLVETFDTSIKTMKQAFTEDDRQEMYFRLMVEEFFVLAKSWTCYLVKHWGGVKQSAEDYMAQFEQALESAEGIVASEDFSVQAALITSNTLWDRHIPQTIEDCFTLAHQSLFSVIDKMYSTIFTFEDLRNMHLPEQFIEIYEQCIKPIGTAEALVPA